MSSLKIDTYLVIAICLKLLCLLAPVAGKSTFLVIAPRSIRSNSVYSLSVATVGVAQPVRVRVRILEREEQPHNKTIIYYTPNLDHTTPDPLDMIAMFGPHGDVATTSRPVDVHSSDMRLETPLTFLRRKSIVVQPGVPKMVNFKIGRDLNPGSYQLEIQTLERNLANFSARYFLFLESKTFTILIQTEKAMYRRNELVRYRVLVLDAETRPIRVEGNLAMSIYDADQTLVLHKANLSAVHGVYSGSFEISMEEKVGVWTIEAGYKGKQIRKSIEVADYVAPRFQVALSVPTKISPNTSEFLVSVDAKYTFGRPVRGTVTISLTPVFLSPNGWPELGELFTGNDVIKGRYLFPFELSKFGDTESNVFNAIMVQASVEERTTGVIVRSHDKTILVDPSKPATKYKITVNSFKFYLPGSEYLLSVQVTRSNGLALPDDNRTLEVRVTFDSESFETTTPFSIQLNGKGQGDQLIDVPATTREGINIRCDYLDASTEVRIASKQLHVEIVTDTPMLNKRVEFRVGSMAPLSSLSYYIVGRGNLLISKSEAVANKQIETFAFEATFAMTPICSLVVFHVDEDGELVSDYTEVIFPLDTLQNTISVTAAKSSIEPRQDIKLTVQTEEGSYIGLSCIDQSSLLLKRGNELSRTRIFNDLQLYDNRGDLDINVAFTPAFINLLKPGSIVLTDALKYEDGVNRSLSAVYTRNQLKLDYRSDIFSNILIPLSPTCQASSLDEATQSRYLNNQTVRSVFPDAILWEDVLDVDFETNVHAKVPDSITSWYVSAFSLHPEYGLGLMEAPLVVTTFKPFFVDVNLPIFATVGEAITVIVTIHNYFEQSVVAEVKLLGDFAVETLFRNVDDLENSYDTKDLEANRVNVLAESESSLAFTIRASKAGALQLGVVATSSIACDTLVKGLLVKPEGLTVQDKKVHALLLSGETVDDVLNIEIPENVINGSVKTRLVIQGDKYSLDLENFQNDLAPPSGSGWTYLREFVSYTVNAKQFLITNPDISGLVESVELNSQEALDYMLESQCDDGGFTTTENCTDSNRDTWFTATNVEVLGELSVFLTFDFDALHKSMDYLVSIQLEDGSFSELNTMPINAIYTSGPRLTAYVLNTFVNTVLFLPDTHRYDEAIMAASRYLITQVFDVDLLSLSLFHNSLKLMNDVNAELAQELISLKAFKNEHSIRWFEMSNDAQTEIELLQLNLQGALLVGERPVYAMKIANGLTQMLVDNYNVSRKSEQARAIRTLSLYSEVFATRNTNVSLSFFIDQSDIRFEVDVNKHSRFLMNTLDIFPSVRKIGYSAYGAGFVNVELDYQFNLPEEMFVKAFGLATEVLPMEPEGWVLNVCTNYMDPTEELKSDMAIMRVQFPVGFTTSQFVQDSDEFSDNIKGKDLLDGGLVVQLKGLNSLSSCFAVPMQRTAYARQKLIGTVEIYEASRPLYRNRVEFTVPSYDSKAQYENESRKNVE